MGLANQYNPENFEWHYSYARLLDRHAETLGDSYHKYAEMAVKEYTVTIALNPNYADAYFYRGHAHTPPQADWRYTLSL